MTSEEFLVLQIRTSIAELPADQRADVDRHAQALRDQLAKYPACMMLAIALVGAELAAQP